MTLKKQILLDTVALVFSGLALVGLFTENIILICLGAVVCITALAVVISPDIMDILGMAIFFAVIAGVGGLILKFTAKMTFLSGGATVLCWALLIFSIWYVIAHVVAAINGQTKAEGRTAQRSAPAAPKPAPQPKKSDEELRKEYADTAYEIYRNAGLNIERYKMAERYARKAYDLGDKSIGRLLEDIESMICEIENDY